MSSDKRYWLIQHNDLWMCCTSIFLNFFVFSKLDLSFRFKRKELAEELQKRSDSLSKLEVDR